MKNWLTVGEFAKQSGLTARAVRLYEKLGLLKSVARGENGYRYFRDSEVAVALRIGELRSLGFSLDEVARLLSAGFSEQLMRQRLTAVSRELVRLNEQRVRIENILSSKTLNVEERKFVMSLVRTVLVTGCEELGETAAAIRGYLAQLGVAANVVVVPEADLVRAPADDVRKSDRHGADPQRTRGAQPNRLNAAPLNADVIVVRNLCKVDAYLPLYANVSAQTATVLNADDMLSIELAKNKCVQAGKIFYYSKNSGLSEQIRKIGGVVSDGEFIEFCGPKPSQLKLPRLLAHSEEVALIAALGGLIDFGLEIQKLAL